MRLSIVVLLPFMFVGCSAQGNKAEYLEKEYIGTHSNGTNHTLVASGPTRAPSPRNRGDRVPTISVAPTPKPTTRGNNTNNSKKPTVKPSQQQQQQQQGSKQPTKNVASGNESNVQPTLKPTKAPSQQQQGSKQPTKNNAAGNESSVQPTPKPTKAPTRKPTRQPTKNNNAAGNESSVQPTPKPAKAPTRKPTKQPTKNTADGVVSSTQPTPNPTKAPTKKPTRQPTRRPRKAPTPSPTTASPSSTPSQSLVPTETPTKSASPTEEPTLSPSREPSGAPSVLPTVTPSTQPTTVPSDSPSQIPSSRPSLSSSPSVTPTISTIPSALPSSSPSSLPSDLPSGEPSLAPTSAPSSVPSASPSHQPSSLPTLSSIPSESPTKSMMPSLTPTFSPSSAPSTKPSAWPSTSPSSIPTEMPSSSPSSAPSNVPSEIPSSQPSSAPTTSSQPSAVPSFSMSPSESGFEDLEAEIVVPVRSTTLMDGPTIAVFETTTMNFLNDYFPADGVTITSVEVTDQTLEQRRQLSSEPRNLQASVLKVSILVKASRLVGDSDVPYPFEQNIQKTFEKHYEVYSSKLVDASSFFRVGFSSGRADTTDENASSPRASPLSGSTLIIVCAVAGCALLALFAAAFVWRIHSRRGSADRGNRSVDLPTSWSHEMSASSGYASESPTESDIYTRQHSRRSIFSDRSSQGSNSQRSMGSERSDSPTVGSPYQQSDDRSIDTTIITNSDRYQQNSHPYSPFASLAPIDENNKMTDIDLTTPRNGRTPKGSEFFEVQKFSGGPITPCGDRATPKHAKFEDCDIRSPKVAFVKSANTPKGTEFVQLNTNSAVRTGSIIDDLTRFERAWDSELDSKVNSVTETPKANNLERYKKAPRSAIYGGSPDKGIYGSRR